MKSQKFLKLIGVLMALIFLSGPINAQERVFIVTGFGPFGTTSFNPSWEGVRLLPDRIADVKIIKLQLPVSYKNGFALLQEHIKKYNPIGILATGVDNIQAYNLEPKAYNFDDDIAPDNEGIVRRAYPFIPAPSIIPGAAAELAPTFLPIDKIIARFNKKNVPVTNTSGVYRYLCNHVFYLMLHELSISGRKIPAGFMHVPLLSPQFSFNQNALVMEEAIQAMVEDL